MARGNHHAEIVNGQSGIDGCQLAVNEVVHPFQLRVVGDHGIIVNHQMDAMALVAFPFQVVDNLMAQQGVFPAVHFHMDAGEPAAGAVIVNHQVVVAQNLGGGADFVEDLLPQLRAGGLAQQGADGVLSQTKAADEDEHCHRKAHIAVDPQTGHGFHDAAEQHRAGGNHVVAAVGGGGHQRFRLELLAQPSVEQGQPQLHAHGSSQYRCGEPAKGHGLRVENLLEGTFGQFEADEQNHHRHRQAGQVLEPGVAVGVVFVRRLFRQLKAQQRHHGAAGIGQVVHGIGGDGHRACQCADGQLAGEQHCIADDSHQASQTAGSHPGGGRIFRFLGHNSPPIPTLLIVGSQSYRQESVFSYKKGDFLRPMGYDEPMILMMALYPTADRDVQSFL